MKAFSSPKKTCLAGKCENDRKWTMNEDVYFSQWTGGDVSACHLSWCDFTEATLRINIPTSTVDPPTIYGGLSRLGAERISEDAGFLAGRSWRWSGWNGCFCGKEQHFWCTNYPGNLTAGQPKSPWSSFLETPKFQSIIFSGPCFSYAANMFSKCRLRSYMTKQDRGLLAVFLIACPLWDDSGAVPAEEEPAIPSRLTSASVAGIIDLVPKSYPWFI